MIHDCVYKSIDGCNISLDCHLPSGLLKPLPILVWFHGGGLLQGYRKGLAPHLLAGVERHDYALVSVDYRLAPQVTVADIVEDGLDALKYIRTKLTKKLNTNLLRTNDIAISGGSAGGYLALLVALRDHELRCCLAIYPISNPLGDFFTHPQPTLPYDIEKIREFIDPGSQVMAYNTTDSPRDTMYFYMMHEANLAHLLGLTQSQKTPNDYIIAKELEQRPICPVYIVHGNKDRFVHIDQAYEVRDALQRTGSAFVFEEIDGADHLFDKTPDVKLSQMYQFLSNHWTANTFTETTEFTRTASASELSSTATASSDSGTNDADEQWAEQLHELNLVLNLILLPLVGKYFGRQFAFWTWTKYMTWRYPVEVIQDKHVQRATSAVVAGLSS